MGNAHEKNKPESRVSRYKVPITLVVLSLPLNIFRSMIVANTRYPQPMHIHKIIYFIGGILGTFILPLILGLIFFAVKRYILKRENGTIAKPFAVILFFNTFLALVGYMN